VCRQLIWSLAFAAFPRQLQSSVQPKIFFPKKLLRTQLARTAKRVHTALARRRAYNARTYVRLHHLPRYIRCACVCAHVAVCTRAVHVTHAHAPPDNRRAQTRQLVPGRRSELVPAERCAGGRAHARRARATPIAARRGGRSTCAWPRALSVESLNPTDHATLPPPNRAPQPVVSVRRIWQPTSDKSNAMLNL